MADAIDALEGLLPEIEDGKEDEKDVEQLGVGAVKPATAATRVQLMRVLDAHCEDKHKATFAALGEDIVATQVFFKKLGYALVHKSKKKDGKGRSWLVVRNILRHSLALAREKFTSVSAKAFFATAVMQDGKRATWFHIIMWEMRDLLAVRAMEENSQLITSATPLGTVHIEQMGRAMLRIGSAAAAVHMVMHTSTWVKSGRAGEVALLKLQRMSMNYALTYAGTPMNRMWCVRNPSYPPPPHPLPPYPRCLFFLTPAPQPPLRAGKRRPARKRSCPSCPRTATFSST